MHDFVAPYSGAKCLLLGCDPYDPAQVRQTFAAAGGRDSDRVDWSYTPPVYPPSTLIELVPFAFLNYHRARIVWYLLSATAFVGSFLLWAGLVMPAYRPWMALLGALLRALLCLVPRLLPRLARLRSWPWPWRLLLYGVLSAADTHLQAAFVWVSALD